MNISGHDTNKKVYVVAEIGNNHEGDFSLAKEMIGMAKESGADAVKFQTIVPEELVERNDTKRLEQLKRFQFSYEQFRDLADEAKRLSVHFLSTPFDLNSARVLNEFMSAFKISSSDNTFYPLLKEVASFKKPIIMSCGAASGTMIARAVSEIKSVWSEPQLTILHCVSDYPVKDEDAGLNNILCLKEFWPEVGYSDHTLGIEAVLASISLGARVIEKHFTYDKNKEGFRDHQLSADPKDLSEMVKGIRRIEKFLNKKAGCFQDDIVAIRRSIAAGRDLNEGHILEMNDFSWVRPGSGVNPGDEYLLLGKKLSRRLLRGEMIQQSDVDN